MSIRKYIISLNILGAVLTLNACTNHNGSKSNIDKITTDSSSNAVQQTKSVKIDDLTKIYTQAIAEFIKAAYKKDKTTFDTLFFGKHVYGQPDDFPDIVLPQMIENTQIRLISPEEGKIKQAERKSLVYINLIGWVDNDKAEFIFVVFSNGTEHQYDYYMTFTTNNDTHHFVLEKIEFENYLLLNGQKPKRLIIFKDGKYNMEK